MADRIERLKVEAALEAQKYAAGGKTVVDTNEKITRSAKGVDAALTNTDQKLSTTATGLDRLRRSIDPAFASTQKLEAGIRTLNRALELGPTNKRGIGLEEHARLLDLLQKRYAPATAAINDNAQAVGAHTRAVDTHNKAQASHIQGMANATVSAKQLRFAVFDLGFQINDVATSLASGARPMQVFAQQAGQIVGAFQLAGGPGALMRAFGSAIASLITPMRAVAVGIGAIGAGFLVVLNRANDNAQMLRSFNVILEGTGKNAVTTAANLQAAARELQKFGVTRSEAELAQAAILRNPSLNAAQAARIGTIGSNVGARLGLEPVAGIERFTAAVQGGLEATIKLGFELGALDVEQANAARSMARTTGAFAAQNQIIAAIAKNVEGARKEVMGPAAESIKSITVAWDQMLDKLGETDQIQAARDAIIGFITGITSALPGGTPAPAPTSAAGAAGGWAARNADLLMLPFNIVTRPGTAIQQIWQRFPDLGDPRANRAEFEAAQRQRDLEAGGTGDISRMFAQERVGAVPAGSTAAAVTRQSISRTIAAQPVPTVGREGGLDLTLAVRSPEQIAAVADAIAKLRKEAADDIAVQKLWNIEQDVARVRLQTKNKLLAEGATEAEAEAGATIAATAARQKANIELGKESTLYEMATAGERRYAEALKVSASAAAQVQAEEQATLEVRQRGGNVAQRTREILDRNAAKATTANIQAINTQKEQSEVLQLQIGLQGQTSEEINRQVVLLQTKQTLERESPLMAQKEKDARLQAVDATQRQVMALAEATRQQQRLEDGIRSIASTIENELTQSIENAFSGKQAESWAVRIKAMMGQLAAGISRTFFIQPLFGTLAAAAGLGNLAQSFGGGFGGFGGGGGGGLFGGGGGTTLTDSSGNVFTLGNASNVLSIGKNLFGGEGFFGDAFSGVSNFFNGGLGGIFAQSGAGLSGVGSPFSATLAGPGIPGATGSLFGATTFGSFAGGIGAGIGGGMLLNSLLGGNTMGGTIGSAGGAIAGTIIGSLLGGPIIGGLLGGLAGGGLGGMFGPKPSNFASGGLLTLGARGGVISGVNTSGNQQNDAISNQILGGVQQFSRQLLQLLPDSTIQGNIYTNVGTRDGIIVGGSIGGLSGELKFSSAEEAISAIDLQIARSLTGLSATMTTVLNAITDPEDLETAINFAKQYDNLKKAFDSAFTSIQETQNMFAAFPEAVAQINTTFKELTRNAIQFGLSLEPIDAGLVEATKRLNTAFRKAVEDAFTAIVPATETAKGPFATALDQINTVMKDATKIFEDASKTAIELGVALDPLDQLMADATARFTEAKIRLVDNFNKGVTDSILEITDPIQLAVERARAAGRILLDDAIAIGADRVAVERLNALTLQQIWKQQTQSLEQLKADLTTGEASGLTGGALAQAANDNFVRSLQLVYGGNRAEIPNTAALGAEAIAQSRAAYGQGPATAALRTYILANIDQILAGRSFAEGTGYSPAGWSLVGERGPEWVHMPQGSTVLPSGSYPPAGGDVQMLLARVVELLAQGNNIGRQGFSETIEAVEEVSGAVRTRPVLVEPTRTAA